MIRQSGRSTILALALAASLSAAPGCLWKHKDKTGAQSKPSTSASKAMPGDPSEEQFERGANRAPTPKTLYALAQILETQGKDDQAEGVLRRIIADEPRFMPAYCELAELRLRQRRIEDAYNVLSAGLRISPNEPILLNNRGMCQVLLKDYDGALANFTRATSLTPDDARYRSNMAMTLAMLGRYDESYSLYTLVMPAKQARQNLAVLADARGDSEQAEKFRTGKTMKPVASAAPAIIASPVPTPATSIVAAPAPMTQPAIVTVSAPPAELAIAMTHALTTQPAIATASARTTAPAIVAISAPTTAPAIAMTVAPTTAPTVVAKPASPAPIVPLPADEQHQQDEEDPT